MSNPRRAKIEAMLAAEPQDQFLRYALAMELQKDGEHERSLQELQYLMAQSPPMVPAFFMAGQLLVRLGRVEEARQVLRTGIEEARRQKHFHAAGEMSEYLASLGNLGE
jgi:predicted Zn-dependent protease